jgi:integrase
MPIADLLARKAKPRVKAYKIFDGEGLYLHIRPSGTKVWLLKYYFLSIEKTLTIGKYPHISIAQAREKKIAAQKLLENGIDPSAQKREDRQQAILQAANTFRIIAINWHTHCKERGDWIPVHAKKILRRLELHAFPHLGNKPISSLKTPDIIVPLRKLSKEGKIETAYRVAEHISGICRYAVHEGLREDNPAAEDCLKGVLKPAEVNHHPTIKSEELSEFFEKLATIDTTRQNKIAVLLLMLTFLRTGELRKSKRTYVDLNEKIWTVPIDLMKMRKMEHIVPLCTQAIALLAELQALTGANEYMFPPQKLRKYPYMNENTVNNLLHDMGYKGKLVGHGFRTLASTTLNEESDFDKDAIEAQLSHMDDDKTRAIYNRAEYLEQRAEMMQWWGDYLEKAAKPHKLFSSTKSSWPRNS